MTRLILPLSMLLLLAACQRGNDSAPEAAAPPAEPAAAPAVAESVPAPTPAPAVAEVPVGQCGDQSATPADQRIANTPKWSTASELENFGYDVYRSESEEGSFERLTQAPIQGAGTSDEPHSYSFRDDSIDPCKDYWYYVEAISSSGEREKFTPTFRAPAKRRAAE